MALLPGYTPEVNLGSSIAMDKPEISYPSLWTSLLKHQDLFPEIAKEKGGSGSIISRSGPSVSPVTPLP